MAISTASLSISGTFTASTGSIRTLQFGSTKASDLRGQFNFVNVTQGVATSNVSQTELSLSEVVNSQITLQTSVKRSHDVTVSQSMGVSQVESSELLTDLEIAQILAAETVANSGDILTFIHATSILVNLLRTPTTILKVSQGLSGFRINTDGVLSALTTPTTCVKPANDRPNLFKIIELAGSAFIELKQPTIGDAIVVHSLVTSEFSRGLSNAAFVPKLRSQYIIRKLKFEGISKASKEAYQAFITTHLGKRMSIVTLENQLVTGIITNPDTIYTDNSKSVEACATAGSWSFELVFLQDEA